MKVIPIVQKIRAFRLELTRQPSLPTALLAELAELEHALRLATHDGGACESRRADLEMIAREAESLIEVHDACTVSEDLVRGRELALRVRQLVLCIASTQGAAD